jgi:hypothetical protein
MPLMWIRMGASGISIMPRHEMTSRRTRPCVAKPAVLHARGEAFAGGLVIQ